MKLNTLILLVFAAMISVMHVSCVSSTGTNAAPPLPISSQVLLQDAMKVGTAAAIGYLEGGKAGAAVAATQQEVTNLKALSATPPAVTAAKNPVPVAVAP